MTLKRSFRTQSIDNSLANLLKPIFCGSKKEFILINNLTKNWEEIVGKKYAQFCYPKLVQFNNSKASSAKEKSHSRAKLTIAVHNSAVGFFLENNSDLIIERIATLYGFKSIEKIIIKQEPKNTDLSSPREIRLSSEKEKNLSDKISEISDENLAATLQKLGREIFKS